ncbi:MAG: hypothetical protein P1P88_13200 [Bacteroidales bacterium]|nr:hypothetical protein [Bacteroidales bacterium]
MTTLIIKIQIILMMMVGTTPLLNFPTQETFEKEVALKNGQAVKLELKFADQITIKTWDKKTLYVKAIVDHNFKEKLEFELLEVNESSMVEIEEKIKNFENKKQTNIGKDHNDLECIKIDIDYEVFMPADTRLDINSISGNIEAKNMNNSLNLETISGFVDISINSSDKYDLKCSTISGSIYTDITFDSEKNIKANIVGSTLNTSLNGTGKKINLKTISGDLFIRKR